MKSLQKYLINTAGALFLMIGSMSTAWAVPVEFTDLDPMYVGDQCSSVSCGIIEIEATNNTGSIWTDFHMESNLGSFDIDSYLGTGDASFSDSNFTLDIVGLSIGIGETFTFSIDNACFGEVCSLGVIYTLYPTTDGTVEDPGNGVSVPEPGSLALLGIGLIGVAGLRRRNKRSV